MKVSIIGHVININTVFTFHHSHHRSLLGGWSVKVIKTYQMICFIAIYVLRNTITYIGVIYNVPPVSIHVKIKLTQYYFFLILECYTERSIFQIWERERHCVIQNDRLPTWNKLIRFTDCHVDLTFFSKGVFNLETHPRR